MKELGEGSGMRGVKPKEPFSVDKVLRDLTNIGARAEMRAQFFLQEVELLAEQNKAKFDDLEIFILSINMANQYTFVDGETIEFDLHPYDAGFEKLSDAWLRYDKEFFVTLPVPDMSEFMFESLSKLLASEFPANNYAESYKFWADNNYVVQLHKKAADHFKVVAAPRKNENNQSRTTRRYTHRCLVQYPHVVEL